MRNNGLRWIMRGCMCRCFHVTLLEPRLCSNVDDKAVSNIVLGKPLQSLVYVVWLDKLNVTCDVVLPTQIHHLLCLRHAPNHATCYYPFSCIKNNTQDSCWSYSKYGFESSLELELIRPSQLANIPPTNWTWAPLEYTSPIGWHCVDLDWQRTEPGL